MAKLPKKIEDWKAPWDGEDIDPEKAKAFAFKLAQNAEAAITRAETAETALQDEKTEHDKTKAKITELEDKDKPEVEKLRAEVERLKSKPEPTAKGKTALEIAMEVGDEHGLTTAEIRRVARRAHGDNDAALKADVESFIEEFGLGKGGKESEDEGGGGDDGSDEPVSRRPVVNKARAGSGTSDDKSDDGGSMESIRKQMPARRF
jgi:hypothetical protein